MKTFRTPALSNRRPRTACAKSWLLLGILAALPPLASHAQVDETPYAWEFPVVTDIRGAGTLIETLREEVDRILAAGRLAPLYLSTSDHDSVGYTIYNEPGRIVLTLAWAYPYLTPLQQDAVRTYVRQEFADPVFSPWGITTYGINGNTNFPLPRSAGAPREDHPKERWWYARNDFGLRRPFLFTLYGTWLYGFRSGDWGALDSAWPAIRSRYLNYAGEVPQRLYGGMGAHIATARLAQRFGDTDARDAALANLRSALTTGLDFNAVETLARGIPGEGWRSPYGSLPDMYDSRMEGTTYRGWVFLNLTPEIGRYLAQESTTLRSAVLARHQLGKSTFPLWWLSKVSYFNRNWTGDEGSGLVPEVIGMIAPVERWVAGAPAATLARQMRGSPQGIGDCYWLEALVQAIEAHGTSVWRDVRYPPVTLEEWRQAIFGASADDPRAQWLADWDGDGISNLLERALALDPLQPESRAVQTGLSPEGRHLTLTYDEVKEAWDLQYLVEVSSDLVAWRSGADFVETTRVEDRGAVRRVTVRDRTALDQQSKRFLRLKVRALGTTLSAE